jgi:hypothetical protein
MDVNDLVKSSKKDAFKDVAAAVALLDEPPLATEMDENADTKPTRPDGVVDRRTVVEQTRIIPTVCLPK